MKVFTLIQVLCLVNSIYAEQLDDDDEDILTSEGSPGWIENQLKKVEKQQDEYLMNVQKSDVSTLDNTFNDGNPPLAMAKLDDAFNKLGSDANSAKLGLSTLRNKWSSLPYAERNAMMVSMNVAAANIGKLANAKDDPVGAVRGAINMVGAFAVLAGPVGQVVNVALNFVSAILGLFGKKQKKQKTVGEIVREQIDDALEKFSDTQLMEEAEGIMQTFDDSKAYVDFLSSKNRLLTESEAVLATSSVPLWLGLKFMGKLSGKIRKLIRENKEKTSRKLLKYIEVYTNVAILKDMILMQMAVLMPKTGKIHGEGLIVVQQNMRNKQKSWFKFLFESDISKNAIYYYDPDAYPITDAYLSTMLKVPNYNRRFAGTWCLTPHITGRSLVPLTWSRGQSKLVKSGHPYLSLGNEGCFFKLIPHGNHLYTIQNNYGCPSNDFCGQYVSFDTFGTKSRATIEYDDVTMWQIVGTYQKRIRNGSYGCGSTSSGSKRWCGLGLGPQTERVCKSSFWSSRKCKSVTTFHLKSNVGYVWSLTKTPM